MVVGRVNKLLQDNVLKTEYMFFYRTVNIIELLSSSYDLSTTARYAYSLLV